MVGNVLPLTLPVLARPARAVTAVMGRDAVLRVANGRLCSLSRSCDSNAAVSCTCHGAGLRMGPRANAGSSCEALSRTVLIVRLAKF